jgi:hypothetical protein
MAIQLFSSNQYSLIIHNRATSGQIRDFLEFNCLYNCRMDCISDGNGFFDI